MPNTRLEESHFLLLTYFGHYYGKMIHCLKFMSTKNTFFLLTMFPGLPATLRAPSVSLLMPGQQFTITWDEPTMNMGGTVDTYFVNISGPNDLCGNVNTLQRVTERSYICSGWTMSTGQTYTFTVETAKCGGALIGPANDPVMHCVPTWYIYVATSILCGYCYIISVVYLNHSC